MSRATASLVLTAALVLAGCGRKPAIEDAVGQNDRKAVAQAIEQGADVNAKLAGGDTPLLLAAKNGQSSSAQALIEAGADVTVRDAKGNGVLHYAAGSGMTGICGLLLSRGISIDDRGEGGRTPLHFAVLGRRQETAKFLVRRGAELDQKDDSGVSALDVVTQSGDMRFRNDLEAAVALRGANTEPGGS